MRRRVGEEGRGGSRKNLREESGMNWLGRWEGIGSTFWSKQWELGPGRHLGTVYDSDREEEARLA